MMTLIHTHTCNHYRCPLFCFLILCWMLEGCVAYDLDYADVDYAEFNIEMDWSRCPEEMMHDGATVLFYPSDGSKPQTVLISGMTEKVRLKAGSYSVVGFNQTFDDFSYLRFRNRDSYADFEVYARHDGEALESEDQKIYEPELFAVASVDSFWVTSEMVEQTGIRVKSKTVEPGFKMKVRPMPVTTSMYMTVWVNGLEHVRPDMSFGTIKGMAEGMYMSSRRNNHRRSSQTFLFNHYFPPGSSSDGQLVAWVESFGMMNEIIPPDSSQTPSIWMVSAEMKTRVAVQNEETPPHYPQGRFGLSVNLTLKDKEKTKLNIEFDISKQVMLDPVQGMNVVIEANNPEAPDTPEPVPVPPVSHDDDNSSGFDAEVGDWDDEVNVDLPL